MYNIYIYINYIICIFLYVIFIYAQTVNAFVEYISEVSTTNIRILQFKFPLQIFPRCFDPSEYFTYYIQHPIRVQVRINDNKIHDVYIENDR